jgi:hypothetical protein
MQLFVHRKKCLRISTISIPPDHATPPIPTTNPTVREGAHD